MTQDAVLQNHPISQLFTETQGLHFILPHVLKSLVPSPECLMALQVLRSWESAHNNGLRNKPVMDTAYAINRDNDQPICLGRN